uniref:Ionotropic receptor n=1 Tax=Stomoxys calcitrans TaxID=35570 RepID=A0A1I8PDH5_STOCA
MVIILTTILIIRVLMMCSAFLLNLTKSNSAVIRQPYNRLLYSTLLREIHHEQSFETILIVHNGNYAPEVLLQAIQQLQLPLMIVTKAERSFGLKQNFNSEIMAILVMDSSIDLKLVDTLANILNNIRHTRILNIAINVKAQEEYKKSMMLSYKYYNMTNVLLTFVHREANEAGIMKFFLLKPYPHYHWDALCQPNMTPHFQQHWRNMQNKTLLTFVEKSDIRSLYFQDEKGKMQLNGYVARFVSLFAELFNVSLQMAYPLNLSHPARSFLSRQDSLDNKDLDIPMFLHTTSNEDELLHWTDIYEFDQGLFMVPCAQSLSTREVYAILLNVEFLGCLVASTLLLSLIHSLIDYIVDDIVQPARLVFSDRVFPAVLGQPFAVRYTHSRSLKILQLLLFILGLYINTQFSVNVKTLLTRPPQHRPIESIQDIVNSPQKILLYEAEHEIISAFSGHNMRSVITTQNYTYLIDMQLHLNTAYSYYISSGLWEILMRQQHFYAHQVFCTYDNQTLFQNLPWAIPLQPNSPYREPLNYLINQIHDLGFMDAWVSSTFSDLLKLKLMSLYEPHVQNAPKSLKVNDLFWTWIMVTTGLCTSCLVFLLEVIWRGIGKKMATVRKARWKK